MERIDRNIAIIVGVIAVVCSTVFDWDYTAIAQNGLTLSSITLAVYIAAIIGLINSDLSIKLRKTISSSQTDKTQLGILVIYFKIASAFSVLTIILSSLVLIIPKPAEDAKILIVGLHVLSTAGLMLYCENIVFLSIIIRFILNRQIWNK